MRRLVAALALGLQTLKEFWEADDERDEALRRGLADATALCEQ